MKKHLLLYTPILLFPLFFLSLKVAVTTATAVESAIECENGYETCKEIENCSTTYRQSGPGSPLYCGDNKVCCRVINTVVDKCRDDRGGVCFSDPGPTDGWILEPSPAQCIESDGDLCTYCPYPGEKCYVEGSQTACDQDVGTENGFMCYTNSCPSGHYPWDQTYGTRTCPEGEVCCTKYVTSDTNAMFCDTERTQIATALGCIPISDPNSFISKIILIATGVAGGIALGLVLYGVFIVTTSAGIPDKLKMGNDIITSAIVGLVFILLSVFLVNFIGINLLGIPGLN